MKKRTYLFIGMMIIFVLSIAGDLMIYLRICDAEQILAEIGTQLAERDVKLKSARAEWEALQAGISEAQEEKLRLLASEDGEVTSSDSPDRAAD